MCPARAAKPRLAVNMAMTLDGKVTRPDGSWHGLTSKHDQKRMQLYRSEADYLILGYKSLNRDNPKFTPPPSPKQSFPIPLILARSGLPEPYLEIFHNQEIPRPILILSKETHGIKKTGKVEFSEIEDLIRDEKIKELSKKARILFWDHAEIAPVPILTWIGVQGGKNVLLEGGPTLNHPFFARNLVETLHLTLVPYVIGKHDLPGIVHGKEYFSDFDEEEWTLASCETEGNEVFLTLRRSLEDETNPETIQQMLGEAAPISLSSHKESQRQLFLKQVLARSARIFRDKRELTTAVEFLNYANDELEKKIEESQKELKIARNIQLGLFPQIIPNWQGLRFWAYNKAMAGVSGDFYDYFDLGSDGLGIVIADVCGHGVPAALISALAKVAFSNYASQAPKQVLHNVNLDIIKYVKMEGYLTAIFLHFEKDYSFRYCVGGMPAPLLFRKARSQVEELFSEGALIGMFPDATQHLHEHQVQMQEGDKLFLYSDGISEATNGKGELLGVEGLAQIIKETHNMDCEEAGRHIMKNVEQFSLGQSVSDDVTLLVIEVSPFVKIYEKYCSQARAFFQAGKLDAAIEELRKALHIFPNKPETLYSLSKALIESGRYIEGGELADRLLDLVPEHTGALVCKALSAQMRGLRSLAEASLKQALAIQPDHPLVLYHVARFYIRHHDRNKAREYFSRLVSLQGESKNVRTLRAMIDAM